MMTLMSFRSSSKPSILVLPHRRGRSQRRISYTQDEDRHSILTDALPHIVEKGFTSAAIVAGSSSRSHGPLSVATIEALFPSPLLPKDPKDEKLGPAVALVKRWLEAGCEDVAAELRQKGLKGNEGVRYGIHHRLRFNQPLMHLLPDALALYVAPDTPIAVPNPLRLLNHASSIADRIAWEALDQLQGETWYSERARIALVYGITELRQLKDESPAYNATHEMADRLLDSAHSLEELVNETTLFANYVFRSAKSIVQSRGL